MSGLREKTKRRRREATLVAAERLFRQQGYDSTTIAEIARDAEISVGTLYKYFGSKSGVMHELIQPVVEQLRHNAQLVLDDPPEDVEDAIDAIFDAYRFDGNWVSLNFMRAFDPHFFRQDHHLGSVVEEFEEAFGEQMTQLLERFRAKSQLNPDINIEDAVFVLYHHMYSHFLAFVGSNGNIGYEETRQNMSRGLKAIYCGWANTD